MPLEGLVEANLAKYRVQALKQICSELKTLACSGKLNQKTVKTITTQIKNAEQITYKLTAYLTAYNYDTSRLINLMKISPTTELSTSLQNTLSKYDAFRALSNTAYTRATRLSHDLSSYAILAGIRAKIDPVKNHDDAVAEAKQTMAQVDMLQKRKFTPDVNAELSSPTEEPLIDDSQAIEGTSAVTMSMPTVKSRTQANEFTAIRYSDYLAGELPSPPQTKKPHIKSVARNRYTIRVYENGGNVGTFHTINDLSAYYNVEKVTLGRLVKEHTTSDGRNPRLKAYLGDGIKDVEVSPYVVTDRLHRFNVQVAKTTVETQTDTYYGTDKSTQTGSKDNALNYLPTVSSSGTQTDHTEADIQKFKKVISDSTQTDRVVVPYSGYPSRSTSDSTQLTQNYDTPQQLIARPVDDYSRMPGYGFQPIVYVSLETPPLGTPVRRILPETPPLGTPAGQVPPIGVQTTPFNHYNYFSELPYINSHYPTR